MRYKGDYFIYDPNDVDLMHSLASIQHANSLIQFDDGCCMQLCDQSSLSKFIIFFPEGSSSDAKARLIASAYLLHKMEQSYSRCIPCCLVFNSCLLVLTLCE